MTPSLCQTLKVSCISHLKWSDPTVPSIHVAMYMDNNIAGIPQAMQKSGRLVEVIHSQLKGKEGCLQATLRGKQVDFSSQPVIPSDPNITLTEVARPISL